MMGLSLLFEPRDLWVGAYLDKRYTYLAGIPAVVLRIEWQPRVCALCIHSLEMTMKPGHHECPRTGCTAEVPRHRLACRRDWFKLPTEMRDAIWEAYKQFGLGSVEHMEAIAPAIEYLMQLQPVPA